MTLATRAELVTSISSYLWDRSDLTARIPEFIRLAEAEMSRRLLVRPRVARTTLTIAAEFVDLPADFGGVVAFELNTTPPIQPIMMTPDGIMAARSGNGITSGQPYAYAVVGSQFRFFYVPNATFTAELEYYRGVTVLTADGDTNWILASHPDAYLYGALLHSAPWLREDERMQTWGTMFTAIMDDIVTQSQIEEFGPAIQMTPSTAPVE